MKSEKQLVDERAGDVETMIKVDHVSMVFNMASEKMNNLKEYAIALARREFRFKELRALDDVSLEVKKGDVYGILGTNGSGKSTLLKIIAGVLEPSKGFCEINGNIAPLIELGAGFDPELTARENVFLNGALLGYSKEFIREHFDEIVSFAEIEDFLDMPMKNYSSGMVARIAFAIATVIVPDILIVDEVLSVGDFMFQQKCERRIDELIKEHQVTVLIVSHNNDQIERLCNKAAWIEKGRLRYNGNARDVCQIYRALGGHVGDEESERKVFDLLQRTKVAKEHQLTTFCADDRYGAVVKMLGECGGLSAASVPDLVLASGEDARVCFVANSVSGLLEAPLLVTRKNSLPDIVRHSIMSLNPQRIIIVGAETYVSNRVIGQIEDFFSGDIELIEGLTLADLARNAFDFGESQPQQWNNEVALLTHPDCTADHISFEPYTFSEKVPVFFNDQGIVEPETLDTLHSGEYKRILAVGGPEIFSKDFLSQSFTHGQEVIRFCGDGAYDSNGKICDWIKENSEQFSYSSLLISSLWMPEDAYAIGPYAAHCSSLVLLEDPQDLDSVVHAAEFIADREEIQALTFIGGEDKYSFLDKQILGKALVR